MTRYLPLNLKPHFQKNMRSPCFTNTMQPSAPFALLWRRSCCTRRLPMPCLCHRGCTTRSVIWAVNAPSEIALGIQNPPRS